MGGFRCFEGFRVVHRSGVTTSQAPSWKYPLFPPPLDLFEAFYILDFDRSRFYLYPYFRRSPRLDIGAYLGRPTTDPRCRERIKNIKISKIIRSFIFIFHDLGIKINDYFPVIILIFIFSKSK